MNTRKVINEQARTKFGKKVIAGLSRHMILMNERIEVKKILVYLSSVIHGTINCPSCQSVVYLFSQKVCCVLGYVHVNHLHCTFLFSGNLCALRGKKKTFNDVVCLTLTEHEIIMCFRMNIKIL